MLKGGYQIVDLKSVPLTYIEDTPSNSFIVEGVYEQIEGNYGKPLLLSGFVLNGTSYPDQWIKTTMVGSDYNITVAVGNLNRVLSINSEDNVTILR